MLRHAPLSSILFSFSFLHALILMLGSISAGLIIGYISPAAHAIQLYFSLTDSEAVIFNSISWLSAALGPLCAHFLNGLAPGRFRLQIPTFCGAASWTLLLTASPYDRYTAIGHRASIGAVLGTLNSVIPSYLIDLSPALRPMHQLGVNLGILAANWAASAWDWWEIGAGGAIVFAGLLALTVFLPEPAPPRPAACGVPPHSLRGTFWTLVFLIVIQKLSGHNVIISHLVDFAGVGSAPALASLGLVLGTVAGLCALRWLSRFVCWCVSLIAGSAALFVLAKNLQDGRVPWVSTAATAAMLFACAFGLLAIPDEMQAEAFADDRVRFTAQSALAIENYVLSFAVLSLYPLLTEMIGPPGLTAAFAMAIVLGGLYGCYVFRCGNAPSPVFPDEETAPLLV
jgi:hypothetical protein